MIQYKNKDGNKQIFPYSDNLLHLEQVKAEMVEREICQMMYYQQVRAVTMKRGGYGQNKNSYSVENIKNKVLEEIRERTAQCSNQLKANGYRNREQNVSHSKTLSQVKKKSAIHHHSLHAFYRYQIVSLFAVLSRRQDFLYTLRGKKLGNSNPMKSNEIEEKLEKVLDSKGKDKGRQKFNHISSDQLRALKYKPKIPKITSHSIPVVSRKGKEQDDDEDDEEDEEYIEILEKIGQMDMQTWKRKNGVGANQKVFIVKGGYADLRKALIERGWFQNDDVWSPHYDFKWTTRICDIDFFSLSNSQSVNHFNNNHHLTSKYGITRRLRTLVLSHNIDADKFYPRCFDLGDQGDFENFVEDFKFTFAESVGKRFLLDKKRYENLQLKMRTTVEILRRRCLSLSSKINEINKANFPTIQAEEWQILTQTSKMSPEQESSKLNELRKSDRPFLQQLPDPEDRTYQQKVYSVLHERIEDYIEKTKKNDPQITINGFRNVWIVKPNFMSRGRGIRCFNNLYEIADYALGRDLQYVAQKYIEHPLVIEGRKFDIRQWVLIQDYNPPRIWFYSECYIRFCGDNFSLENISNRFIHLTNNSIQKYNKKATLEDSMWSMSQLAEHIGVEKWAKVQQKMKNIVVWTVKSCEGYVLPRKGSCQLVGYDFMIDANLDPWLIQINMSPSMDYSTPITKNLVKMVLTDTAKIISSKKNKDMTGGFQLIYKGNEDLHKYNIYNI